MPSLTRVNRIFYASAHTLKHRDQFFSFKEDMKDHCSRRSHEILTGLLNDPTKKHILLSIRSVTVNSVPKQKNRRIRTGFDQSTRQAHERKWLLFADLLSRIPHLKSFTLQGTDQISVALLDAFERYQHTVGFPLYDGGSRLLSFGSPFPSIFLKSTTSRVCPYWRGLLDPRLVP